MDGKKKIGGIIDEIREATAKRLPITRLIPGAGVVLEEKEGMPPHWLRNLVA